MEGENQFLKAVLWQLQTLQEQLHPLYTGVVHVSMGTDLRGACLWLSG